MDKETDPTNDGSVEQKLPKPVNKSRRKKILLCLLILFLIALAGGGGWWWRDKTAKKTEKKQAANIAVLQSSNASLKQQLAAAKAKNSSAKDQTLCAVKPPSTSAIDNIQASITSGNTAALEGYMAPSVNVVHAAADALAPKTPSQAVTDITSFITSDTTSWNYDFGLSSAILSTYSKGSYGQYFPDTAVVGRASNKQVISFSFDCNGKISTVFMAANDSLLQ